MAFAIGTAAVAFDIAYRAHLPHLVDREQLIEGNSKLQLSQSVAGTAGPGLGGTLVQALTAPIAVCVDAFSFAVSAISLASIRRPEPEPTGTRRPALRQIGEGLAFTFGNPILRAQVASVATFNLFVSVGGAVSILYLANELRFGPAMIGIVLSTGAPGAVLGAIAARQAAARIGVGRATLAASVVAAVGAALLPAATRADLIGAVLVGVAVFLMGLGNQVVNVNVLSVRQSITPNHVLGRVGASSQFLTFGLVPLGAILGGVLGTYLGLRATLVVAALGTLSAFVWLYASPFRSLRDLPADSATGRS